ncbi:5'/3'-nucleotidase SurE [Shewanella acanthi]|uniref:5'/3'-nucleotidase SurE n=1 Tax=Shewanella acanthi TaxID=2864212 RepID=UPI001C6570EB|nr:5'/3'-nucleotidase SurE [Shewanella acanthi]QYJ77437.1 5'/3'-nucleotidase SurE [Shewanella acanthi]
MNARMIAILGLVTTFQSQAIDILITNDDGFETPNIQSLYKKLKEDGHRVIISAPYGAQSSQAGALHAGPIPTPTEDSPKGTLKAGVSGLGCLESDPNICYVNSKPVVSMVYGLDVVAWKLWGKSPDLVISGPNEGFNFGVTILASGTLGAASNALHRNIPTLAISAAESTKDNEVTAPEVASIAAKVVSQLVANPFSESKLLPDYTGVNLNIPQFDAGQGSQVGFRYTQMGHYGGYPVFFEDMSTIESPIIPVKFPAIPGAFIAIPSPKQGFPAPLAGPASFNVPFDENPESEGVYTFSQFLLSMQGMLQGPADATITIIDADYTAKERKQTLVRYQLSNLVNQ